MGERACHACGTGNPANARFCMACGAPQDRTCPACGAVPPAQARFCMECGTPLETAAAGEVVPAAPARAIAPTALPEERRNVTVLFADLAGYTAVADRMDPEDVK